MWVTLLKLPLWETGSTSKDTQLQITLPRTTQGDSPEAVPLWSSTPVSSLHSIIECPSEAVTGPSLTEEIADLLLNPMFEMPGVSSTCNSPHAMAQEGGNPQSRRGTPGLPEATTSLPSWVFTGGYGQHYDSFQLLLLNLVLQTGAPAQLLLCHWPTLSIYWWMYCTLWKR